MNDVWLLGEMIAFMISAGGSLITLALYRGQPNDALGIGSTLSFVFVGLFLVQLLQRYLTQHQIAAGWLVDFGYLATLTAGAAFVLSQIPRFIARVRQRLPDRRTLVTGLGLAALPVGVWVAALSAGSLDRSWTIGRWETVLSLATGMGIAGAGLLAARRGSGATTGDRRANRVVSIILCLASPLWAAEAIDAGLGLGWLPPFLGVYLTFQLSQAAFILRVFRQSKPPALNVESPVIVRLSKQYQLSPREQELVLLIHQATPNKIIAATLSIAEETVKKHLSQIFKKTHTQSRAQLMLLIQSAAETS